MMLAPLLIVALLAGADPQALPLYPGETGADREEAWVDKDGIRRVRLVTRPSITPLLPEPGKGNGAAVVVFPGGGFRHLAIDKEGFDVARWLNGLGVAAFVVKYRLVTHAEPSAAELAVARQQGVADAMAAVRIVRARAREWKLDPKRVGAVGFSAGGYHAASLALQAMAESRPDFVAAIYPARPESIEVPPAAPPLFLLHADDDRLSAAENSVPLYAAYRMAGRPAELHILRRGGHGFGMGKSGAPTDTWTERFQEWMAGLGVLDPK